MQIFSKLMLTANLCIQHIAALDSGRIIVCFQALCQCIFPWSGFGHARSHYSQLHTLTLLLLIQVFVMPWDGLLAPTHISHLSESSYLIWGKLEWWDITGVNTEMLVRMEGSQFPASVKAKVAVIFFLSATFTVRVDIYEITRYFLKGC